MARRQPVLGPCAEALTANGGNDRQGTRPESTAVRLAGPAYHRHHTLRALILHDMNDHVSIAIRRCLADVVFANCHSRNRGQTFRDSRSESGPSCGRLAWKPGVEPPLTNIRIEKICALYPVPDKGQTAKKPIQKSVEKTGTPNGTRTRVSAVKGRRPRPLDDGRGSGHGSIETFFAVRKPDCRAFS